MTNEYHVLRVTYANGNVRDVKMFGEVGKYTIGAARKEFGSSVRSLEVLHVQTTETRVQLVEA